MAEVAAAVVEVEAAADSAEVDTKTAGTVERVEAIAGDRLIFHRHDLPLSLDFRTLSNLFSCLHALLSRKHRSLRIGSNEALRSSVLLLAAPRVMLCISCDSVIVIATVL